VSAGGLDERTADPDPLVTFARWFAEARRAGVHEPEAMTLATATPDGVPSARMVLLRGWGPEGFDFYTNYRSRKGRELDANPRAALVLHWYPPGRQVRVEGAVARLPREASAAYFHSRPRGHRIGAWASEQGRPIAGRDELQRRVAAEEERWRGREVELPPFWGGYRLVPEVVELWQAGADRLHDRLAYLRGPGGAWSVTRLSP